MADYLSSLKKLMKDGLDAWQAKADAETYSTLSKEPMPTKPWSELTHKSWKDPVTPTPLQVMIAAKLVAEGFPAPTFTEPINQACTYITLSACPPGSSWQFSIYYALTHMLAVEYKNSQTFAESVAHQMKQAWADKVLDEMKLTAQQFGGKPAQSVYSSGAQTITNNITSDIGPAQWPFGPSSVSDMEAHSTASSIGVGYYNAFYSNSAPAADVQAPQPKTLAELYANEDDDE